MASNKINISDEENFRFFFVLFQRLFTQFFFNGDLKDKSGQVTFEEFLDKNPAITFNKFSGEIAAKSVEEVNSLFGDLEEKDKKNKRIGASTIEEIVKKLSGRAVVHDSKLGKNNYDEIKLDALCRLLPKGQNEKNKGNFKSWAEFLLDKDAAVAKEKISPSFLTNLKVIRNSSKPKVLFSFSAASTVNDPDRLKISIKENFQFRLSKIILRDKIVLEFDTMAEEIQDNVEAGERAKKSHADLIVWGHFSNEREGLFAELNYLVCTPHLKRRISGNSYSYDEMSIRLKNLRSGKLIYREVDQTIFLILAIGALIKNELDLAISFINEIPEDNRCDEAWFILGNCHYLMGEEEKGLEFWNKTIGINSKHLRAKINVARHQLSIELREGSLSDKTARFVKKSLKDYDPKNASIEESALIGVLFSDLGEKEMAIKALEAALRGNKKLEEASYYHIRLGQLKEDPTESVEEYVKAALATEQPELQELCLRLIADCRLSDVDEKRRLLAKIRDKSELNGELRRMNIEHLLANMGKDTSAFTDFIVYEVTGHLRKNQSKDLLKNGDGLNFDDWVLAENNAAKAVLLKCNNQGVASPIKRLYLKPGSAKKVEETLYEYAQPLRSSDSDDEILLLSVRELKHGNVSGTERIRVVCHEIGLNMNLAFDEFGRLMLDRRMFDPFSGQMARKFTPIEIQQGSKTGVFTTIRKLRLLIPDDDEVGERVVRFSELIDISDNKYYAQLAGYLSDFYAPADETDIKLWSVARQLSWME